MTNYAAYQSTAVDDAGNVIAGASIEVRSETTGSLATIYSGRTGGALANPFNADSDGYFRFHAEGDSYKVRVYTGSSGAPTSEKIYRYVPVGLLAEADTVSALYYNDIARAGLGLLVYAATTFVVAPDGVNARMAISDTSAQLHYDNIVLGTVVDIDSSPVVVDEWPRITWKIPDYSNDNAGLDHPLGNIGANASRFIVSAGADGPSDGTASLPLQLATQDTAGTETVQVHIAGSSDVPLIGVGTTNPLNDIAASSIQIHGGAYAAHIHFTNTDSDSTATDGAYVGINASEQLRLWNYENQTTLFGVNNQQVASLSTSGFAVGVGGAINDTLQLYKAASGSSTHGMRLSNNNTSSGETHTTRFSVQDNNAGTVRTLFYAAGALNSGVANQGIFDIFVEAGSINMARVISTGAADATAGAQLLVYDRASSAKVTLAAVGTSTFAGGGVTVSGGAILSTHATGGIGYSTGAGGTVTQITSRTTGVTINKPNGAITLVSAAGSASYQTFTVTNSTVAATDIVRVVQKSGTDKYIIHVTAVAAGSFDITYATTGGTTTEQPVFSFSVIKGSTS